eukprot:35820-Chlamydomonas_euryale.AAC.1
MSILHGVASHDVQEILGSSRAAASHLVPPSVTTATEGSSVGATHSEGPPGPSSSSDTARSAHIWMNM